MQAARFDGFGPAEEVLNYYKRVSFPDVEPDEIMIQVCRTFFGII